MAFWLRLIAWIEGVSTLVLFGVCMPLKYIAEMPEAVAWTSWAGRIHGGLFVAFAAMLVIAAVTYELSKGYIVRGIIAAIIPGGPFIFDRALIEPLRQKADDGDPEVLQTA